MKILNQIDFFIDFLEKKNQQNIANFIKQNKKKIAFYFNKINKNINKCYCNYSIKNNKLYLIYRNDKSKPFKHYSIDLEKIKTLEIKNQYQYQNQITKTTLDFDKKLNDLIDEKMKLTTKISD